VAQGGRLEVGLLDLVRQAAMQASARNDFRTSATDLERHIRLGMWDADQRSTFLNGQLSVGIRQSSGKGQDFLPFECTH